MIIPTPATRHPFFLPETTPFRDNGFSNKLAICADFHGCESGTHKFYLYAVIFKITPGSFGHNRKERHKPPVAEAANGAHKRGNAKLDKQCNMETHRFVWIQRNRRRKCKAVHGKTNALSERKWTKKLSQGSLWRDVQIPGAGLRGRLIALIWYLSSSANIFHKGFAFARKRKEKRNYSVMKSICSASCLLLRHQSQVSWKWSHHKCVFGSAFVFPPISPSALHRQQPGKR